MINRFWVFITKVLLSLRYRIRIVGLDKIVSRGKRGILLLPNHPALIDPVILLAHLYPALKPRPLADRHQINRPLIRRLAERMGAIPIEDIAVDGTGSAGRIRDTIENCSNVLKSGGNVLLYPSGKILRSRYEDIGANSAAETIIRSVPEARIVLVRTEGLWGSSFSWSSGRKPSVAAALRRGLLHLLLSAFVFMPKRDVSIELHEPEDIPRGKPRVEINRYIERFYNTGAPANTYIPYTPFEAGGSRRVPEPRRQTIHGDPADVPEDIRNCVYDRIEEISEVAAFRDDSVLSADLGMDSLAMADLLVFLQSEYAYPSNSFESIHTVGDVLLAAAGLAVAAAEPVEPPPAVWTEKPAAPALPAGMTDMTVPQAFLHQARRNPKQALIADEVSGVKTYRDIVLACMVLEREIRRLPGDRVGIMMPASATATILYMASLCAGKTPAMINWTLGRKLVSSCIEIASVKAILTSGALVSKLKERGMAFDDIEDQFRYVEEMAGGIGRPRKLFALAASRLNWSRLDRMAADCPKHAAVLFTSGSETAPKAVPLTHRNILSNIADVYECFSISSRDCLVGILPPFHSFGLSITTILPLALSLRSVYTPDPTAGGRIAAIIGAYEGTIIAGTPSFLAGILRSGTPQQLSCLRLAVSGAEKCPKSLYDRIARTCPDITVMEGYGATECSPIISVNHEDDARPGTIGRLMRSLRHTLVDPETGDTRRGRGLLLVRGPSVFEGYLGEAPDPFVERDGYRWYETGDLVEIDKEGILTFSGRIKRFVKVGGEMVSLPAIEAALRPHLTHPSDKGPAFAVIAAEGDKRPKIILVSTRDIEKDRANGLIRTEGLSSLCKLSSVLRVDELPLLGSGKTDYRSLRKMIG